MAIVKLLIQMLLESPVGNRNEISVETILRDPGLVSTNKENRPALRIEGKGHAPYAAIGIEPQFLHVGKVRTLQCVHGWTP